MAYYPKKPRLTHEDVIREIYNRTGIPINGIYQVLWTYNEIVKESLLQNVEVPFGEIGYFSWKQIAARDNVKTYNYSKREFDEPHPIDGFRKTVMRINAKWGRELKEKTRYHYGEKQPE